MLTQVLNIIEIMDVIMTKFVNTNMELALDVLGLCTIFEDVILSVRPIEVVSASSEEKYPVLS